LASAFSFFNPAAGRVKYYPQEKRPGLGPQAETEGESPSLNPPQEKEEIIRSILESPHFGQRISRSFSAAP
jgi:hypothetical protein